MSRRISLYISALSISDSIILLAVAMGEQKVYFYFFKRPERYNQEVLSHSFICLLLPYEAFPVVVYVGNTVTQVLTGF